MGFFSKIKSVYNYINQPIRPTFLHLMVGGVVFGAAAYATYQLPAFVSDYFKAPEPEPEPIYIFVEKTGNYLWSLGAGTVIGLYSAYNKRWYNETLGRISGLIEDGHHYFASTRLGSMLPTWALPKRKQRPEQIAILKSLTGQLLQFNPEDPRQTLVAVNLNADELAGLCTKPFAVAYDGKSNKLYQMTLLQQEVDAGQQLPMVGKGVLKP